MIAAGLAALFLVGAPIATVTVADSVYRGQLASQRHQAASVHRVAAVLLPGFSALVSPSGAGAFSWPPQWERRAAWITPNRMRHTGEVRVPSSARAGGVVMVWVDRAGRLTDPPLSRSTMVARAFGEAFIALMALTCLLALAWRLARWTLDRRRLAAWESAWSITEPRWTKRGG